MRTVLAIAILAATALPAAAEPAARPATGASDVTRMVTDDCARARKAGKTCVLEVAAEDVGGVAPTADQIGVAILRFGTGASLIRVRLDFIPEILKTAEDL
jgi:hypothetical protein